MLFYGVLPHLLLLYKKLPSKVKYLRIVIMFTLLDFFSLVKESYTQAPHYNSNFCISYRNYPACWRNIRAHPGARRGYFFWSSGQRGGFNWSPELWFGRARSYWPYRYLCRQAPVHNPIISNYEIPSYFLFVHLSYWSCMKTLDA